jgi:hypothetical protein
MVAAVREQVHERAISYEGELTATRAEIDFVRGLGTHCIGGHREEYHTKREPVTRLQLLTNYRRTLDWEDRDWGRVDVAMVRGVVDAEIAEEVKHRPLYIPQNGHGICGARSYARPVRRHGGGD